MRTEIKDKLIAASVKNLKAFGYPGVTSENILTDRVFKTFFAGMLHDTKGKTGGIAEKAIDELLAIVDEPAEDAATDEHAT